MIFFEYLQEKEIFEEEDEDEYMYQKQKKKRDDLKNPAWAECKELGDGDKIAMNERETEFWGGFIQRLVHGTSKLADNTLVIE